MFRKKKYKRTINDIGKRKYDFDFKMEKLVYLDLCCMHVKKRDEKKLCNKSRCNSYLDWKIYIINKYKNYDNKELIEFSRYLNHRIRTVRPNREYWSICSSVMMTLLCTKMYELFINTKIDFSEIEQIWVKIFVLLILILIFIFFMLFIIGGIFNNIWNNSIEENMLIDYKEIIDEMIQ